MIDELKNLCLHSMVQIKHEHCLSIWDDVCKAKELLTINDELHRQNNFSIQASATLQMQEMNMSVN